MNLDSLNKWLTLAANIGVMAGIIFLVIEIQQNTNALYADSRQSVLFASQNELFKFMENSDLTIKVANEGKLTNEEQLKLGAFLAALMRLREYSWLQYRDGVIDETQWEAEVLVIRFILDSRLTRAWWENTGKYGASSDFVAFVEEDLKNNPMNGDSWLREINWADKLDLDTN